MGPRSTLTNLSIGLGREDGILLELGANGKDVQVVNLEVEKRTGRK